MVIDEDGSLVPGDDSAGATAAIGRAVDAPHSKYDPVTRLKLAGFAVIDKRASKDVPLDLEGWQDSSSELQPPTAKDLGISPEPSPTNTTGKLSRVPWQSVEQPEFDVGAALSKFKQGQFKIESVTPDKSWVATQGYLHEGDFPERAFDKAAATKAFNDNYDMPPTLVKQGDKTYIIDGHHRFETAMRKGESVRAAVLYLDKK